MKTPLAALAFGIACSSLATASGDLERGVGFLDVQVGWSEPSRLGPTHAATSYGARYGYHLTPRLALGAGIESCSFERGVSRPSGSGPLRGNEEVDLLTAGPFVRWVLNPAARVRAHASGGITLSRTSTEVSLAGGRSNARDSSAGAFAACGLEVELGRNVLAGVEARHGYLDVESRGRSATLTTLAVRLGYRF